MTNGWLIIDKPADITSAQVVSKIKATISPKKIGHGGTLDPFATGMLLVAIGEATKTCGYILSSDKEYEFTIKFGEERDTEDLTGKTIAHSTHLPSKEELLAVLTKFRGAIKQTPPIYSALKLQGKRAYSLARSGEEVKLAPRDAYIYELELLDYQPLEKTASFRTMVSKGTYIRSLGRDIAREAGSAGYLIQLRRTKIGNFMPAMMISVEKLLKLDYKDLIENFLYPVDIVLDDILEYQLDKEQETDLRQGKKVSVDPRQLSQEKSEGLVKAKREGKLVALCEYLAGFLQPIRVFNL